jgi:hypothetical protein
VSFYITLILPSAQAKGSGPGTSSTAPPEQVEVIVAEAKIKIGQEEIARVKQGDRLTVVRRAGPWIAVEAQIADSRRRGWVFASCVKPVIAVGIDERSTAPAAPVLAKISAEYTQFPSNMASGPMKLMVCFQLKVSNQSGETIACDAEHITLKVGDAVLQPVRRASIGEREQDQGGISGRFCANWLRISKKVPSKSLIA